MRQDDGTIFLASESLMPHIPYKRQGMLRKFINWTCAIVLYVFVLIVVFIVVFLAFLAL